MDRKRRLAGLMGCCLLVAPATVRADSAADARWLCPYTQDRACVPAQRSYGYYPTRWRKWPGAATSQREPEPISAPTPTKAAAAPEENPTEELPPKAPRETPDEIPDAAPGMPGESETEPDLPPELKSNLPQPAQEQDLEKLLPDQPDEIPTPPADDTKPHAIPDSEDPFNDDPLPEDGKLPDDARRRGANRSASTPGGMRWRPDPRLQRAVRTAVATTPARLRPSAAPAQAQSGAETAARHDNPLRARSDAAAADGMILPAPLADDEVVTTADWSPDAARQVNLAGGWRANPLRAAR